MAPQYHSQRGKTKLTPGQVASYARQAGWDEKLIPTVVGIATGESGLDPYNLNPNASTGDESYGLMQINMLGGMGPERLKAFGLTSKEQLYDPLTNLKAAKKIYDWQGFPAWSVYSSGAYKQHVPSQLKFEPVPGATSTSQITTKPTTQTTTTKPDTQTSFGKPINIFINTSAKDQPSASDFLSTYKKLLIPDIATQGQIKAPTFNPLDLMSALNQTQKYG